MKISDYLDDLDLVEGQNARGNCPVCHGRNTFTASFFRGNILYNCYKNSCRVGGVVKKDMDAATIQVLLSHRKPETQPESYSEQDLFAFSMPPYISAMKPNDHKVIAFMNKWNINPDDVMYDVRQDRVVFPVYTENNVLVDAVGRSMTGRTPKWLRYASSPVPYVHGAGEVAVIVEDAISAYVVGEWKERDVVGVALLGTQLTDFHRKYIKKWFDKVIVALDPDARDKSLKIAKELGGKALNLKDDLKYRRDEDFYNLGEMIYANQNLD